jgi:hypothetical protein
MMLPNAFKNLFVLQLGACYNGTQPSKGMRKLADAGNNALTTIKLTDRVTTNSILIKAEKDVAELKKQSGTDEKPNFEMRAKAKVKANDHNYAIQATIGTKEGAARPLPPSSALPSQTAYLNMPTAPPRGSSNTA